MNISGIFGPSVGPEKLLGVLYYVSDEKVARTSISPNRLSRIVNFKTFAYVVGRVIVDDDVTFKGHGIIALPFC